MSKRSMQMAKGVLCALGASVLLTALADPLSEHSQGSVRYVTGGIGKDESDAIKSMEAQYSLTLTFAQQLSGKADYLANVPVTIRDDQGRTVFSLSNDGPYLLVKLAPGSYDISASYSGQMKTQRVTVGSGHNQARVAFEWS